MKIWTYGEFRKKILKELDLEDETFIQPDEMIGYTNDAIDEAEAEIHKLNCEEDYFLTCTTASIISGQSDYDLDAMLPNIYGMKIRSIMYNDGVKIYPIKRVRRLDKFAKIDDIIKYGSECDFRYIIRNDMDVANTPERNIVLLPTPINSGNYLKVWYIRNANKVPISTEVLAIPSDSYKLDIPEFVSFLMSFVKYKCMFKETMGNPPQTIVAELEHQREMMTSTLTPAIPDDDDQIEIDRTFYGDSV